MSRKGNCREYLPLGYNAILERFFHLEYRVHAPQSFQVRQAMLSVLTAIAFMLTMAIYGLFHRLRIAGQSGLTWHPKKC